MSPPSVILDSDFLSSFLKIEQLALVRDFYQAESLSVPPAVYREVSQTSLLQQLADIPWVHVETPEPEVLQTLTTSSIGSDLGAGETEAIALALRRPDAVLLMSDNRARREATQRGVQVLNIPAFLLACKISGFLGQLEIDQTISALQEKDGYAFRKDVLALLMG